MLLADADRFVLTLIVDDQIIATNYCYLSLHKSLRLGWELLGGIPQAELCIRRHGKLLAWLHTNFRGELEDAELHGSHTGTVTSLNPNGPIFQNVFAGDTHAS